MPLNLIRSKMRVPFSTLFTVNEDGSLEPKVRIRMGGVTIGPGFKFTRGVNIAGLDLTQYVTHDLEVTQQDDVFIITGIY